MTLIAFRQVVAMTVLATAVFVSGCSDDGSVTSSGMVAPGVAGLYRGSAQATATVGSQSFNSGSYPIEIIVESNGQVRLTDSNATAVGTLRGNSLSASYTVPSIPIPGTGACNSVTVRFSGTLSGKQISGPISGDTTCVVSGQSVPGRIRGSYSVTKV